MAPQSGLGDPRGRKAAGWGGGCFIPQSPLRFFPFSLPKLPGSPRLPRQPLLPGAVTKETPCPPLPPSPSLECPPPPQAAAVWKVGGAIGGENSDSRPREGAQTYIQRGAPLPASLHPQPHSRIRSDRQTCISTPHPSAAATPHTELRTPTRPSLPPASALQQAPPIVLCRPPPHPGGGLRPRSPN